MSSDVAATLHFEDHGQDFLEWDLNAAGEVIACRPFQGFVWVGATVTEVDELQAGDYVFIKPVGQDRTTSIRYPLVKVERAAGVGP